MNTTDAVYRALIKYKIEHDGASPSIRELTAVMGFTSTMTQARAIPARSKARRRVRRKIRPPQPPPIFVLIMMCATMSLMGIYWHKTGLIDWLGWYMIGVVAYAFRDYGFQGQRFAPPYPMQGRPLWARIVYILAWPVTLVFEVGYQVYYLIKFFRGRW